MLRDLFASAVSANWWSWERSRGWRRTASAAIIVVLSVVPTGAVAARAAGRFGPLVTFMSTRSDLSHVGHSLIRNRNEALAAASGCSDSWKNAAGGAWENGKNWSKGKPPTSSQKACIVIGLHAPVVVNGSTAVGSLALGGSKGRATLDFHGGQTFTVHRSSMIADTGLLTNDSGAVKIVQKGTLTNHGVVEPASSGLEFLGNLTNATDGLILPAAGATLAFDGPGTLANKGEFSLPGGSTFVAPYAGGTGATFVNAGAIENNTSSGNGTFTVSAGASFKETTGTVSGAAPIIDGTTLDLAGPGASQFELQGDTSISGNIAASQTLVLAATNVTATGSFTNRGTITDEFRSGTLTVPAGDTLTNEGLILVPSGLATSMAGNIDNASTGRIELPRSVGYNGTFAMNGPYTLTNHGTIIVSFYSTLTTGAAGTIDNAGGTIQNDGTVSVPGGGTFIEGDGTTTGNPVQIFSGSLNLQGTGASQFVVAQENTSGTTSGNIAADQVVQDLGINATASFTNNGTLIAGHMFLPAGDTLTNNGTIELDQGELLLKGSLDNTAAGVIGVQGGIRLGAANTKFTNEGRLYMFYGGGIGVGACACGPDNNQFINTGTIYLGVESGTAWGGFGLAPDIVAGQSESINLGGTIVPVPRGEPPGPPSSPQAITYGFTTTPDPPGSGTPTWTLSCSAAVGGGWTLRCTNPSGAVLVDSSNTSAAPTQISIAGSGAVVGSGWASTYGQPVTLTATISAQSGPAPTGTVTFFAHTQPPGGGSAILVPHEILGTAPLSTSGGVTTATLTLNNLQPGQYQLQAFYSGSAADLAAWSSYMPYINQTVNQSTTTTTLTIAPASPMFGKAMTLTAHITPSVSGAANPSGSVYFVAGNLPLGNAPVTTANGHTTASITTSSLLTGGTSVVASYGGDYNYTNSDSQAESVTVTAPKAPTRVKVTGPRRVATGATYRATSATNGRGAVRFSLAATPAAPKGLTINSTTGKVTFKVPATGLARFSYAVVAANAAGRAESSPVKVASI